MPYVTIPKDLSAVKTKVVFNLTKRQLICFGGAALLGMPTFFAARSDLGGSVAVLIMILVMLPLFFIAMYERDGLPAEKLLQNIIRTKFSRPAVRVYETDNFYAAMQRRGDVVAVRKKTEHKAAKKKAKAKPRKSAHHCTQR